MNTSFTQKFTSPVFLILSVLLLVLSCPFKRMLQINSGAEHSLQQSPGATNLEKAASITSISCNAETHKVLNVQSVAKIKLSIASSDVHNLQTGFDLNYYLSRTKLFTYHLASASLSALPIFLQHRRLLL